jgi:putative transposase
MKMHVAHDPCADAPQVIAITDASVNDAQIGRTIQIEAGVTYVFDQGHCHYGWWRAIAATRSSFVTRNKTRMRLDVLSLRPLEDAEVKFASKGDSKLPIGLRRLRVKRHQGGDIISLLTSDMARSAVEIAAICRWQIELLFRWIKQHLKIRKFLGNNDNAIRLQLFDELIAYALLRIAVRVHQVKTPILRFIGLVSSHLFHRRDIANIGRPPPVNPSKRQNQTSLDQISFSFG